MPNDKLKRIEYISLPEGMEKKIGDFKIDSKIKLPVVIPDGKKHISPEDVTLEAIVSGMLTVIAYDKNHKDFNYFKSFVLACQGDTVEELNAAAMTKAKQKDFPFAEQLFLTVYHMLPQSASCINLATLYNSWAVHSKDKGDEKSEDLYLAKAHATLEEGLEAFGENEDILAELGSFETYMGNFEDADEYLTRYMKVAAEGEKKQKLKKMLRDVRFNLESDNEIKQAYDFMMLQEEDKALKAIEGFIRKNPKLWHGHFIKGWALRIKKEYAEAEKEFLECLKLGERNSDIYNELAICSLEGGKRELAKNYLEIAMDLDEDNLTLVSNLAFLRLSDGEYDEAKKLLEKARSLSSEDGQVKAMMEEYTKKTGESFGDIIHEEYVDTSKETKDGDGYEEELEAIEEDNHSDGCHHHEHHHDCHCHDDGCYCHHGEEE